MTNTQTITTLDGHIYRLGSDGFCAELGAYVARDQDGHLVTIPVDDALHELGELYRNAEGHEVWRIRDRQGRIVAEDVASDYDAEWIAANHYDR